MNLIQKIKTAILALFITISPVTQAISYEDKLPATVQNIVDEQIDNQSGEDTYIQTLKVKLEEHPGKITVTAINANTFSPGNKRYQQGDKIFVIKSQDENGSPTYQVYDYNRTFPITALFVLFLIITVWVARIKGISSILAMGLSFMILFYFVLPNILSGGDSLTIAILSALIIIPINFYFSHGINKKTTAAIISTIISLVLIGTLSTYILEISNLTGKSSEDVTFLMSDGKNFINFKELLLAGIIIGLLGILDDITISQAAIVYKLKEVSPKLKSSKLFSKAMDVGRDHIASVVNTLILVYAGASLPLLLLFLNNPAPFTEIINEEFMAEEIIRTLTGSIGVILAVPITTFIATWFVNKFGTEHTEDIHIH